MLSSLESLNSRFDSSEKPVENTDKYSKLTKTFADINQLILKSVENCHKKYEQTAAKQNLSIYETKHLLIAEAHTHFASDLDLFNINQLNRLLARAFKQLERNVNDQNESLNALAKDVWLLYVYLNIYVEFSAKWVSYLMDLHAKTTKCLNILLYVFNEFKVKGLTVLPEEEEEEETGEGNEAKNKSKKFEEDPDPSGLGEGQGSKDVSDQIETEDQLEDAKRKDEEEEKDEEKNNEEEPVEESEKGIEMSDDFEGQMNDVEMEDQEEENDKNDEEDQEEELDDQKG
jgi:hypothetical protein